MPKWALIRGFESLAAPDEYSIFAALITYYPTADNTKGTATMEKHRVLQAGAYGYCIRHADSSHVKLYPHWMTVTLAHLYEKAVQISESVDYEAEITIYADGFVVGRLKGQL